MYCNYIGMFVALQFDTNLIKIYKKYDTVMVNYKRYIPMLHLFDL